MASQPQKKAEENPSETTNGTGIKFNNNVRVTPGYSNKMIQSLGEKQKTHFAVNMENEVGVDVMAYQTFMMNVMGTPTTPEKIIENFVKAQFAEHKPFLEWKKKNPQYIGFLMEQVKTSAKGQPGAFFAPISSSNDNGQTASATVTNGENLSDKEDDDLLENLKAT